MLNVALPVPPSSSIRSLLKTFLGPLYLKLWKSIEYRIFFYAALINHATIVADGNNERTDIRRNIFVVIFRRAIATGVCDALHCFVTFV